MIQFFYASHGVWSKSVFDCQTIYYVVFSLTAPVLFPLYCRLLSPAILASCYFQLFTISCTSLTTHSQQTNDVNVNIEMADIFNKFPCLHLHVPKPACFVTIFRSFFVVLYILISTLYAVYHIKKCTLITHYQDLCFNAIKFLLPPT